MSRSTADPRTAQRPGRRIRDMVWVPGGEFLMGSDHHYPEEAPAHRVAVGGFWIDRTPVTNEEYRRFVDETGHVSSAERPPDPDAYPGALPEMLVPASVVFRKPRQPVDLRSLAWWTYVHGANWRHPRGPQSSLRGLDHHPVVHVAWEDVEAYAHWADTELPTEAEWEFAARGGSRDYAEFAWGDELTPNGQHMANVWQGDFPYRNECLDGYDHTSPVGSFPPNGLGLYDMIGNVWEWTVDWFGRHPAVDHACCTAENPRGGERDPSTDASQSGPPIPRKVMKGGSHLCAPNYCRRYRPPARMAQPVDTSTSHLGFRCIVREPAPSRTNSEPQ